MAPNGATPRSFACKCLNVRIHAQATKDASPAVEAGFSAVHVADDGILVAHTEVTLRTRCKPIPDSGSPTAELTRHTTITCLVCGMLVYRVAQRITPDLASEEGPLLPTEDWVEKELCKSSSGWIEVYRGCLTGDEITQAESSPLFSTLYNIVLPGGTPPSVSSSDAEPSDHVNVRGPSQDGRKHLPELPPLFLPPPFTPSHVVFSHFAAVASERSQQLRDEAEESLARLTEQKVAEVHKAEAALKQEVQLVWTRFMDGLRIFEQSPAPRRRTSVSGNGGSVSQTVAQTSASVRISSFVPTRSPSTRTSPQRMDVPPSALSTSLKTSAFHHPDAQRHANGTNGTSTARGSSNGSGSPSPPKSSPARVQSTRSSLTPASAINIDAETSIREAYRREMSETKDTATSFRYVLDIEAEMEQHRRAAEAAEAEIPSPPVASSSHAPPEDHHAAAGTGKSPRIHKSAIKHAAGETSKSPKSKPAEGETLDVQKELTEKGKRKVTFDVQPAVAVIDEGDAGSEQLTPPTDNDDLVFDMDNESETSTVAPAEEAEVVVDQTKPPPPEHVRLPPVRPSHSRSSSNSGLPPQLQSLRPASLPAPSSMRPPSRNPTPPSTETAERSKALRESLVSPDPSRTRPDIVQSPIEVPEENDSEDDPRQSELLRLVNASTPSHRNAWKKNSKAWQVFYNRRDRRAGEVGPEPIHEESSYTSDDLNAKPRSYNIPDSDVTDEDDDAYLASRGQHGIAQSLPIPIGPLGRDGFEVQPKTSLADQSGLVVPALRNNTSTSLRRQSYAERERKRSIDPGALDFIDSGDDDDDDDVEIVADEIGSKARQRALKIIEKRNEMPEAGMWRSLAA
ncbi:uncharacterized protein BXZ73DRAFT_102787 [Epithele typhae]|uniref:uncharacterized protein n=1 Tax=Epithele typhae TaxID=378194 RepID=UPI0020077CC8|nr:uncharacterized protein BXZ73DRAFT_102787 [Epithele typhae]KAH9927201.1 hypothetical protein BXZ73DRAFT_102787 [Epithele typhae]